MMERRFVVGNRGIERREASRQNLNTIEFSARLIERAIKLVSDFGDCSVLFHLYRYVFASLVRGKAMRLAMVPIFEELIAFELTKCERL